MTLHMLTQNKRQNASWLLLVLLLCVLASCLVACDTGSLGYSGKTYTVTIQKAENNTFNFEPTSFADQRNLTVLMNDTVTIDNPTDQSFSFVSSPGGSEFDGQTVTANDKLSLKITKVGTWTIKSKEHPELEMTLVVQ